MDKDNLFYVSGLLSFIIFLLFILPFLYMIGKSNSIKTFSLRKDNYISISLNSMVQKNVRQSTTKEQSTPVKSSAKAKNIDINNLFNDVWTKDIVSKKEVPKKQDMRLIHSIEKKIKTSKSNSVESVNKKIKSISQNEIVSSQHTSSAEEVNEYLAKIQAIVYQYFNVPANSEGNSVKTIIELNAFGKVLDFRVLTYSQNEALNREADSIKDRIRNVVFPINPNQESTRTVVILTSKELF